MSLILSLQCDVSDCQSMIHGEETIDLADLPPRYFSSFDAYANHGHMVLRNAEGLRQDLREAALAAGWHWDGSEWRCKACTAKAVEVLAASYDALDTEALMADLAARDMPTVAKLEAVARLLNL